CMQPRQTPFTF
nr:immunoglobulin light chain junction region [Macaca mulatta]